jgi:enoyl-CoA hydratase
MSDLVTYELTDGIATITMDDTKVNVMSTAMSRAVDAALDRAEADAAVVILAGRKGVFSAGFDMAVFQQGPDEILRMLRTAAELAERIMAFPFPVVAACTGHAIAMGAFLMAPADVRIGSAGPFRIGMNEVAISLTVPLFALAITEHRLTPAHYNLAATTGRFYTPEEAVVAGFLDRVVPQDTLAGAARETASALAQLDMKAHRETKLRVRAGALRKLREAIDGELGGAGSGAQAS